MGDVKWIKVATDIFDDEKILMIESLPEADSILIIWFKLLALAGKTNNGGVFTMSGKIAYDEKMFACVFKRGLDAVHHAFSIFEDYGMIEIIDTIVTIPNWNKHQTLDSYEKKKERDREYSRKRREEQAALVQSVQGRSSDESRGDRRLNDDKSSDSLRQSSNSSADLSSVVGVSDKEEDKEEDKDNKNIMCTADADALFDSLWELYPEKKGKGQVSTGKKNALLKIGREQMVRAIERYISELKKTSWKSPQNGSTFFKSGYVDYLDAAWEKGNHSGRAEPVTQEPAAEEEEELVGDDW